MVDITAPDFDIESYRWHPPRTTNDVVYVAYQGDVTEFQSVYVVQEPTEESELTKSHVLATMRACLAGWWATSENQVLADASGHQGKYIAPVHGFVVRVTSTDWKVYDVEYTSDSLEEAVIRRIHNGTDEPPVPIPLFFFNAFRKSP
jgi:hypothetical protein